MQRPPKRVAASLLLAGLLLLPATPFAQTTTVAGVTDGSLAVGPDGSAGYSIPIKVPPGIAGMAPSLSLGYSSGGGNGSLGVGWGLGGLSSVHRCPRTIAQDGAVGGINFDAADRFCLDGQRLVAIAGVYGADGTEYRTEIESFTKVVSYGAAGAGPAWFKAWTKSGQAIEFGNTADSRVEAPGRSDVRLWAANRISDSVGNYLTQSYFEDTVTGAHRIERIDYAGNDGAAVAPFASLRFSYEPRPDPFTGYQAGSPIAQDQRMTAVRTYLGETLVRDYRFAYDQSPTTGRSRLVSVTECDGSGDCLYPISFAWQEATGPEKWQSAPGYIPPMPMGTFADGVGDLGLHFVDLNGDGLVDMVKHRYVGNNSNTPEKGAYLNTGSGWQSAPGCPSSEKLRQLGA